MTFNKDIEYIFEIFKKSAYQIYLVGGCVRDMIMGLEPHDYDFTTDATPKQMKEIAEEFNVEIIPTGEKYGTMTFKVNGSNYEITTFRADGNYSDGRRPDDVIFSNKLEDDLKRRDFTINALAMDSEGNIIDLFKGQEDIKNRIIRAIGDPDERFQEDGLRVMRALRFAYRFKFKLDFMTENALIGNIKNLKNVSQERIDTELFKILDYKGYVDEPNYALEQVLTYTLLHDPMFDRTNYQRINLGIRPFNPVMDYENAEVKLAYFAFKYCGGDVKTFYKKNKFSNILKKSLQNIVNNYQRMIFENDRDYCIRKCLSLTNKEDTLQAICLYRNIGQPEFLKDRFISILDYTLNTHQPISLKDLALNGDDLKELGYEGKEIKIALEACLEEVLHNPNHNTRNDLLRVLENVALRCRGEK